MNKQETMLLSISSVYKSVVPWELGTKEIREELSRKKGLRSEDREAVNCKIKDSMK